MAGVWVAGILGEDGSTGYLPNTGREGGLAVFRNTAGERRVPPRRYQVAVRVSVDATGQLGCHWKLGDEVCPGHAQDHAQVRRPAWEMKKRYGRERKSYLSAHLGSRHRRDRIPFADSGKAEQTSYPGLPKRESQGRTATNRT